MAFCLHHSLALSAGVFVNTVDTTPDVLVWKLDRDRGLLEHGNNARSHFCGGAVEGPFVFVSRVGLCGRCLLQENANALASAFLANSRDDGAHETGIAGPEETGTCLEAQSRELKAENAKEYTWTPFAYHRRQIHIGRADTARQES